MWRLELGVSGGGGGDERWPRSLVLVEVSTGGEEMEA